MKTPAEITVAFGIDAGYVPHLAVAIVSCVRNAPTSRFRFHVMHEGVTKDQMAAVEGCVPGHAFEWHAIGDTRMLALEGRRHISRATFFRFAIPELVGPDVQRAIYLDSDLVVTGDLAELQTIDLQGNLIGAVFDPGVDVEAFAKTWGLAPKRLAYFNAGVLVLDVAGIRRTDAFALPLDLVENKHEDLDFMDQDALNIAFWDRWKRLDPVWNVQRRMAMQESGKPCFASKQEMGAGRRPKIIHFTEYNKPWSVDAYHPLTWKYYEYLRQTPFWDEVCAKAQTTTFRHLRRYVKTRINWARLSPSRTAFGT